MITGAAGGLGSTVAGALAAHGANLILADINADSGQALADHLSKANPASEIEFCRLNLADLAAIREFAGRVSRDAQTLDMLINIAGIYPPAKRSITRDGFELATAINYLGHFALTGMLLPALMESEAPRVVSISSITQARAKIHFGDLQFEKRYEPIRIYGQSKLACLMFGLELQQHARAAGSHLQSMVAHPGIARTGIGQERKNTKRGLRDRMEDMAQALAMRLFGQPAGQGALPLLYAATAPEAAGGAFYGPDGFAQFSGFPIRVEPSAAARDAAQRRRLWEESEKLTGANYSFF